MATSSNRLAAPYCSSSSSSSTTCWDVFLSFYGKDTRKNFTSHLYSAFVRAGILTFMDDPQLHKGEEISSALLNAIRSSKIFVVVLSQNYAFSRWCLDELVEILACKRTGRHVVIPVFYYVDPSYLRYQKGSFGEALDYHKKRYSVDLIDKWKSALAEIAELSGYHLKMDTNENESDIVQEIVENLTPLISRKDLYLEENLVGIDSSVEEIYRKLCMESNDVRAIGICGMGGIGKTTTAKAFYNKYFDIFDISCFVDDLKPHSQGGSYLLPLLQQLSVKLFGRSDDTVHDVKSGVRQLKQFLCNKKALIVVDDLNQSTCSEFLVRVCNLFSVGSRIIFTTRDAYLAKQLKEDVSEVDIYMMRELDQVDSLELFSYHAFRQPTPPESFKELSASFIAYAAGLPLALKVLGSSLLGRTEVSFWKEKLVKVQEIGENDIQQILRLSYDELGDETLKAIFLDIAFFFVKGDKDEAVHVFQSCGFFPNVGIPILVERCLLTVDENNKFQMHNLIQCMGNEVIREESKHGNCRRLYLCGGDACMALQNLEGIQKMEGLIIDQTKSLKRHFNAKILERMPNLRLLEIIGAHDAEGDFKNVLTELRCIRWSDCPWKRLPSSFHPPNLVSLHMPFSDLRILWKDVEPLVNLKTIDVSHSRNLKIMPDFTNLQSVEKLVFRGCKSLLQVHPSIRRLNNLSHLDLGGCDHIKKLTEPIEQLTKLGHLDLGGCVNLKRLPEAIIQLTILSNLNLGDCHNLTRLPEQLGDMKCLKMLDASCTSIEQLPDSIGYLKELVNLKLYGCKKLRKLPERLGDMKCLKMLDASHTSIEQLPDSIGYLKELVELRLYQCKKLRKLPEQLGDMKCLKLLDASCTSIEQLPDSIVYLKELVNLKLYECKKFRKLPEQLGDMKCLKMLDASCTSIKQLPDSIGYLKELVELKLYECKKLRKLPEQIGNMESLKLFDASWSAIEQLPDTFGGLINLDKLDLGYCKNLTSLPNTLWKLKVLRVLDLGWSSKLEQLPEQLGKMQCLERLSACGTAVEEVPDSIGLLSMLKVLNLEWCIKVRNLPSSIWNLTSLAELSLPQEDMVKMDLPDMVKDMKLKSLGMTCDVSLWLPLILSLSSLEKLNLRCESQSISPNEPYSLSKLSNLQDLTLHNWTSNECSSPELPLNLMLPDLSGFKQLKSLSLRRCISLQSIPPLPPHLERLELYECTGLQDLPDLSMLKELRRLELRDCMNLKSNSLKQSILQVGQHELDLFEAIIPNKKVAEWFSYKSSRNTLSFTIPPNSGDNFFSGFGLWIVYKCKFFNGPFPYLSVVITNRTKGTKMKYPICLWDNKALLVGEVQSRIECNSRRQCVSMESGDRINISIRSSGEMKVENCGAHVMWRQN